MKTFKKVVLALLSLAMLFALTSCGGSGNIGNTEEQLTSQMNEKLSDSGIHLAYDAALNEKAVIYLDVYNLYRDESAALKAAGLDPETYAIYVTTSTSTINDAAAVLASQIKLEKEVSGRVAKKVGYASATLNGHPTFFALTKF